MIIELHDLRESKVWQEAHKIGHEEGREEGRVEGREVFKEFVKAMALKCLSKGMTVKEVAALVEMPLKDVKRLAKKSAK